MDKHDLIAFDFLCNPLLSLLKFLIFPFSCDRLKIFNVCIMYMNIFIKNINNALNIDKFENELNHAYLYRRKKGKKISRRKIVATRGTKVSTVVKKLSKKKKICTLLKMADD